ncbi:MAG: hypothetical protein ABSA52_18875 [Candidatus Binatia bacterium]|jgi:hypothetical protein
MNPSTQYSALRASLTFLIVAALATAPARAMVVVKRDFPDLVARSEQIVIGTVTDIHEQLDASGTPFTLVTFSDLTVLKGDIAATLTLRFYGGHAGDAVVAISDMPTFTIGERDVLFVAGNNRDVCPLVGVWQGRFYVHLDPTSGTDVVEDSSHQPLTGIASRELVRAPATSGETAMTLNAFRQLIVDELAQPQPAGDAAR